MKEFALYLSHRLKEYKLNAIVEYKSNQIMRIRVLGSKSSILLENNYPFLKNTNSKKGIQWKIREGQFDMKDEHDSRLLMRIFELLEYEIKKDDN
jgi:hypothetical protein